jgi:excisionase family DNA binding protein
MTNEETRITTEADASTQRRRLLTLLEAAGELRISRWMIFQLIQSRELRTLTIGTRRFVAREDLDAYIDARRAEEAA